MPHAAAVRGVNYTVQDTQSSWGCPCVRSRHPITQETTRDVYVSYSAVNISVTARNEVGNSPPAIVQVPAKLASDLKGMSACVVDSIIFIH